MSAGSPVMSPWLDSEQQDIPIPVPYSLNQKLTFVIIMMVFVVVCLSFLFYKRHPNPPNRSTRHPNRHNRRTHIVYIINNNRPLAPCSSGLNASILKSLPLFVYSAETKTKTKTKTKTNADVVDCAVCLSEFENGEEFRVLPNCEHCFHTGCIDMWFYNHSTCPLCRSPVEPKAPEPGSSASPIETKLEEDKREQVDVIIDVPVYESVTEPSCVPVGIESDVESAKQESDRESS